MAAHGVRFAAGSMVSPGQYRNCDNGAVRYFDGNSPLPGGVNSPSWEQVSDHFHAQDQAAAVTSRSEVAAHTTRVRFAAGTMVSPGEYRNCDSGAIRYFDGNSPLPGGVNAPSWEQVSDHFHAQHEGAIPSRGDAAGHTTRVRFAAGTMVSPGEYRNCDTGSIRYFDGNSPLPGGVNAPSWEQVSDHHHVEMRREHRAN